MEIKELAQKAKENDSRAWTELFTKTKDMVYFTALKICGNKENAEDIVQETYIKAMQNISSLSAPEAFVTWLRTIAVNTTRNHLAKHNPTVFGSDESDELLINAPETEENFLPEAYASKRETARIIMRIIDSLPEKQRVTVMLYYYNEMSVADIAKMMDVSENTVKSRLNYARTEIKTQVEELEKKGTKLHGTAMPFLALALREAAKDYVLAEEATAATLATITAATAATAVTTATAATATATAAGGIFAKIAALPIATKIIAGVLGAAIAIGGVTAAVSTAFSNGGKANGEKVTEDGIIYYTDTDGNVVVKGEDGRYYLADENTVFLTKEQAEKYSKLDLATLFAMDRADIEALFGEKYDIHESDYMYILNYRFAHSGGVDDFCVEFAEESSLVSGIQFMGSLFNYNGLCTAMSIEAAKENINNQGMILDRRDERSEEWGEYTEENYSFENGSLYMMYADERVQNLSLYVYYEEPVETESYEETTSFAETEAPTETTAPEETTAPVAETVLLYTFKQNDAYTNGLNESYIPYLKLYSDGTFEGLANIYYATVKVNGTWTLSGNNYTMRVNSPSRTYEFDTEEFNLRYQNGETHAVVTFYPGDSMGITVDGAKFDYIGEVKAPDATTNEGAHRILEEFRLNNRTNSNGSISYAYADVTHDGIEELIIMKNSTGPTVADPSATAYYEVFTLNGGKPEMIYNDGTGFTTNSMYEHYLYIENGKAYLMRAAFFERQGSPWYFYEIFSLAENGEKISYKGRDVVLEYGYTDSSPLDLVSKEYKEAVNSSRILVLPYADAYDEFYATIGWWYNE